MGNGMCIGKNAENNFPDLSPNFYHGKRDAYLRCPLLAPGDKSETGTDKKNDYAVTTCTKLCFENCVKSDK
jgi:hypothetical protein